MDHCSRGLVLPVSWSSTLTFLISGSAVCSVAMYTLFEIFFLEKLSLCVVVVAYVITNYPRNFFHSPNMPHKSDKSAQAALKRQGAHYRAANRLRLVYPPPPCLLLSPINKHGHSPARSILPGGGIAKNITRTRLSPRRPATVPRCTCTRFLGATPTTRSLFHKASLHLAT